MAPTFLSPLDTLTATILPSAQIRNLARKTVLIRAIDREIRLTPFEPEKNFLQEMKTAISSSFETTPETL